MSSGLAQNILGLEIRLWSQYIRDMLIICVSSHAAQADMICTWVGFEHDNAQTKRVAEAQICCPLSFDSYCQVVN